MTPDPNQLALDEAIADSRIALEMTKREIERCPPEERHAMARFIVTQETLINAAALAAKRAQEDT